jgi:prepilin-type N-terminal cleavage/methylation domain-containing protein
MTTRTRRRGFTLLEVILVMAVIVMLVTLSIPSYNAAQGYFKMTAAVDAIRAACAQARAHAIEEGRPYRVSVVPDTGNFRVAPDLPDFWGGSPPSFDPENPSLVLEQALPKGIKFVFDGSSPSAMTSDVDKGSDDDPSQVAPGSWSSLIVYNPDGSARDDVGILLQGGGAMPTKIMVRGLTGTTRVRQIKPGEDR